MAPRQKQAAGGGGGKKKETNKATITNQDDECSDMPPLEDMRKTESTTGGVKGKGEGGGKEGKKETKLLEPRWSQGEAPQRLTYPEKDVRDAYRLLEIEPALSDDKLYSILDEKSMKMLTDDELKKGTFSASMGAILSIACSRYDVSELSSAVFLSIIQRIYIHEANYHLNKLELPLPRHLPEFNKPLVMEVTRDQSFSLASWDSVKELQNAHSADKARLTTAEKEAKGLKGENEKMKTELVEYKAEVKEGYKARDEKAAELEKVRTEKEDVRSELEKRDEKVAELEKELAKLQASSSSPTSSQVASSDKTSFVIKSLSRQVRDLGRQVKEKNDQLAEMMVEMSKGGLE